MALSPVPAVVTAVTFLASGLLAVSSAPGPPMLVPAFCPPLLGPPVDCEDWVAIIDGPAHRRDFAHAMAASPDGARIYVTGDSETANGAPDLDLIAGAVSAADGTLLWATQYVGAGMSWDIGHAITTSPDGARVFVAGHETVGPGRRALVVLSLDAASGEQRWASRFEWPDGTRTAGTAVKADPGGQRLYVGIGEATGGADEGSFGLLSMDAETGSVLWVQRVAEAAQEAGHVVAVDFDASNGIVYATGHTGPHMGPDPFFWLSGRRSLTVAVDAATGQWLWKDRLEGSGSGPPEALAVLGPAASDNAPVGLRLHEESGRLFVAGSHHVKGTAVMSFAIAYAEATGKRLWTSQDTMLSETSGLEVGADGGILHVAGVANTLMPTGWTVVSHETTLGVPVRLASLPIQARFYPPRLASDESGDRLFLFGQAFCRIGTSEHCDVPPLVAAAVNAALGTLEWQADHATNCDCVIHTGGFLAAADGSRLWAAADEPHPGADRDITVLSYLGTGPRP